MLKLGTVRFKGRCKRHPGFDPEGGAGAVKGGCKRCDLLVDIYQAHLRLTELIRQAKNEEGLAPQKKAAAAPVEDRQIALF
jgi:hypothetical protein